MKIHSFLSMRLLRLTLALAFSITVVCVVPNSQKESLVALYNATGGSSWTDSYGWNSLPNPCMWSGVMCDATENNVLSIILSNNSLTGTLPDLQLPSLITL